MIDPVPMAENTIKGHQQFSSASKLLCFSEEGGNSEECQYLEFQTLFLSVQNKFILICHKNFSGFLKMSNVPQEPGSVRKHNALYFLLSWAGIVSVIGME